MVSEVQQLREWLKVMVFDEEIVELLLNDQNIESMMNLYKRRQEGWKKKL
jgi:hypothetical protein